MVLLVNGGASLLEHVLRSNHEQAQIQDFYRLHAPAQKAVFVLLAVVAAPLAEEMVFRVFLFNALRRYFGFWIGALASGLLFGAAHLDLYAVVPLMLGGVLLCAIYARTRNVWMSMVTHSAFNAVTIAALAVAPTLTK